MSSHCTKTRSPRTQECFTRFSATPAQLSMATLMPASRVREWQLRRWPMSKPKRKSNIAKATESAVAFGPQHIELIRDRLGEIQGKIYLAANLAYLIAPNSEEDIEMHTALR